MSFPGRRVVANLHQIQINAPKCPDRNQQRGCHMRMGQPWGRDAYEPNLLDPVSARAYRLLPLCKARAVS